jgi:hypothetical protein
MNALVHSANVNYAVIQLSSEPASRERLVLAYLDEQSLCDFIAERSIIARGFTRREDAAAFLADTFTNNYASAPQKEEQMGSHLRNYEYRKIACNAFQFALASAVLLLYSKNLLSSMIRIMLGV